jgi:tetratricopeptide (TPR) repeat protein
LVQQSLGNSDAARQGLERAAELYARAGNGAGTDLSLTLAKTAAQLGHKEMAHDLIVGLVRNNHENDELLKEVEAACAESGMLEAPGQLIQQIRREIVDLNNRGVHLATAGKIDEAIGLFEEAADAMVGNRAINLNAAKVMLLHMESHGADADSLGRTRKYLERVRRLDPQDPGLAQVMVKLKRLLAEPGGN